MSLNVLTIFESKPRNQKVCRVASIRTTDRNFLSMFNRSGEPEERNFVSIELHQDMFIQRQIYSKSYATQTGQP